ncbi:unnamed protein product [Mycena citricolor]|uniref:J domain-containing protein n=1 Tax=Mycena citricolor TaxID=2018698 RepID=A0AAD2HMM6_9AGAR|nr:unnamed protein product [Mycena citricolor]
MDGEDPITQFFPDQESVDLYAVLSLTSSASSDEIRKAYRRLALQHHPDKLTTATDERKAEAAVKFQQIGFVYAVLSDEKRRERYDRTGKTDEGFDDVAEDGWEAYFEDLFDRVTRGKLDEMKKEYQGSDEELEDLKAAYVETEGSISDIMTYIPHSTFDDEPRFIVAITRLIKEGALESLAAWEAGVKDEKAKLVRKKQGEKEAEEAEQMAKELGVWDEFYGSGKATERQSRAKGKGKAKQTAAEDEDGDVSALQALILKKQKKSANFFDSLAEKYAEPEPKAARKGKGKKRTSDDLEEASASSRKKQRVAPPPIDGEEFEKLQQKLLGDKPRSSAKSKTKKSKS